MAPRVSVIVATRNRRRLLARAVASVDRQRHRDFEVIVVDDGSDDGTIEWLRAQRPQDCLVEHDRPRGAAASRNDGLAQARGEIIAFLDDDDVWHPEYLETQIAQLDSDHAVEMSTTGHVEVDRAGRVTHPDLTSLCGSANSRVRMLAECPVHTMSLVACRRSAFLRVGVFDETLEIVHDLDWYVRFLAAGCRYAHDPAVRVERAVPGGLVSRYREWFVEERTVHERILPGGPCRRPNSDNPRRARAALRRHRVVAR